VLQGLRPDTPRRPQAGRRSLRNRGAAARRVH